GVVHEPARPGVRVGGAEDDVGEAVAARAPDVQALDDGRGDGLADHAQVGGGERQAGTGRRGVDGGGAGAEAHGDAGGPQGGAGERPGGTGVRGRHGEGARPEAPVDAGGRLEGAGIAEHAAFGYRTGDVVLAAAYEERGALRGRGQSRRLPSTRRAISPPT